MKEGTFEDFGRLRGRPDRMAGAVGVHEAPKKPLCPFGPEGGYTFLRDKGGYRFGTIRD